MLVPVEGLFLHAVKRAVPLVVHIDVDKAVTLFHFTGAGRDQVNASPGQVSHEIHAIDQHRIFHRLNVLAEIVNAIVVIDAVARLVPGVLPNEEAYTSESHTGNLLEAPEYTMPAEWNGVTVPEVLRNGNDAVIAEYNHTAALLDTLNRRPDLFDKEVVSEKDWEKMLAFEKGL